MSQTVQETIPSRTKLEEKDPRFLRAQQRVRAVRGFYIHLGVYLIVNLGIFLLNWVLVAVNEPGQNWFFYWPLLGWGIAVVINAFAVFGSDRFFGPDWEERKIREEMTRHP